MRRLKILAASLSLMGGLTCAAPAQITGGPGDTEERALSARFGQAATRAIAGFQSADSVDRRLRGHGNLLHPGVIAPRARIESALDECEAALRKTDFPSARQSIARAEALIDQFANKIGGY